jgi:hypothetical protein
MKLHILSLAFFLCMLGFSACETILDPKEFTTTPKLVVHCFFFPQNPWEVELSASRNLLNDSLELIWLEHAEISISGDDGSYTADFEYLGNGKYINSSHLPTAGVTYSIHIKHDGYQEITASDYIPSSTEIDISLNQELINGKTWMHMTAVPVSQNKFIHTIISNPVRKTYLDDMGETLVFDELALMTPEPSSFNDFYNPDPENQPGQKLFIKELRNNTVGVLSQGGYRKATDISLINAVSAWTFCFGSEAYFNYQWSKEISKSFPGSNGLIDLYKIEYFSNINNGYGIFAGFNLKKYEKPF